LIGVSGDSVDRVISGSRPGAPIVLCGCEMAEEPEYVLPKWAPRVPKKLIARMYEASGKGLLGEDLVDEVGYAFLARAQSMLDVSLRYEGKVSCVLCGTHVETVGWRDKMIDCPNCEWVCSWVAYKKTIKHKKLHAGGMRPFLEAYITGYPKAKSIGEKVVLIDTLIHRYHWETSDKAGRPGSAGLIEGKMVDIMPFLDQLSYGENVPPEVEATRAEWRRKWSGHGMKERIARRQQEEAAKRSGAQGARRVR